MAWFIVAEGQKLGPLSDQDVMAWARSGRLKPSDLVWQEGMPGWLPAGQVPQLSGIVGHVAAPTAGIGDDPMMRALLPVGRSGWAIAAGYLGLFALLVIPAPLALICGLLAVRDIRQNPQKHGMGRAVFGIVLGGLGTLALVFFLVASLK
jgi:hypothetical protein